nr:hypothetical protein [Tanacetum cinerariifolium]
MRIEPTVPQKKVTFQVFLDIIKTSPCFKGFTVTADVPEIYMKQSQKILDIYPRVPNEDFVAPSTEEELLTFLIELGYKGPLNHLARIIGEDFQEYGRAIPETMLTEEIKQTEAYQTFIKYSTGLIPPKKTRKEVSCYSKACKSWTHIRVLSEGAGVTLEVPNESTSIFTTSSEGTDTISGVPDKVKGASRAKAAFALDWGSENKSGYFDEDTVDEEIEWLSTDEEEKKQNDDDDDKSIDIEKTNDDEETNDEYVHDDVYVHNDVDEEMKDAEVYVTGKDDNEGFDAAKADAKKTKEVKGDNKKASLPPIRSNLSVSSGFGNQFLNLSFDISLVGMIKNSANVEINSLLDIQI